MRTVSFRSFGVGCWAFGVFFAFLVSSFAATPQDVRLDSTTHRPLGPVSAIDLSTTTVTFANDQIPQSKVNGLTSSLSAHDAAIALKAADSATVHNTGNETITGTKTYSSAPAVPDNSFAESKVASLVSDLTAINSAIALKAADSATVHNTGNESIAGTKTFSSAPAVPDNSFAEAKVANLLADLSTLNSQLSTKAADTATVHNTGNESIAGTKTFSIAPVVPSNAFPEAAITNLLSDLGAKASDSAVVHNTGNETIAGAKTYTGPGSFYSLASNSVVSTVLSIPGAPTVTVIGAHGSTTWTYKIVAKLSDGAPTAASSAGTVTDGDDNLDATNKNSLTWSAVTGAASYDVYRSVAGGTPSTIGKIANVTTNSYVDAGAAGDASSAPTLNTTGRVTGAVLDKGGAFFNILSFGGAGDAVTDNLATYNAAVAAIKATTGYGTIYFPDGTFLFSGDAVVGAGINVIGSGRYGTELKFLSGSLVLGDASHVPSPEPFNGRLAHLTVSRASSFPPPAGSIGIKALYYQYPVIDDVFIVMHDIGLKTGNGTSTLSDGLKITNTVIFDIGSSNIWLEDAIQTTLVSVDFGKGGVLNDPTNAFIVFSGVTDTVNGTALQLLGSPDAAFAWQTYTSANGIFQFTHLNVEGPDKIFRSDAGTARVNHLQVTNSRLTCDGKFADFNAATELTSPDISHNPQISFATATTLTKLYRARFCSNVVAGAFIFDGGGDGELSVIDNTFQTDVALSGAWTTLTSLCNKMRGPTIDYTLTATGGVVSMFNIDPTGGVIAPVISGTAWIDVTPTSSWVNFNAASEQVAGYHKTATGEVELRGFLKNGNLGAVQVVPTLPAGFRPSKREYFAVAAPGGAVIRIETTGAVILDTAGANSSFLSLSGIRFTPAP